MASRPTLADCRVTLGVTGSIAAYKTAEIVRLLTKLGIQVQVVMTRAATRLMSTHALATLSGAPVITRMFRRSGESAPQIDHLEVGREADLLLVAPATANILGKAAGGIADDLLSTAILASPAPVLFAPAMNCRMWENPIVAKNVAALKENGCLFVGPDAGDLACGETGAGRMVSPEAVVDLAVKLLLTRIDGLRILVTAGPTEEVVDPVRVLSNRSSGIMGVRIAEAARDRGHRVTLIAGPLRCPPPLGVERIDVTSAAEMQRAVQETEVNADIMVMAAAVADYRVANPPKSKIVSGADTLSLELTANPDILGGVGPGRLQRGAVTVGFALELGEGGEERARSKLKAKGVDMMVLNDTSRADSAFGGDTIRPAFLFHDGRIERLGVLSKRDAAEAILTQAEDLRDVAAVSGTNAQ